MQSIDCKVSAGDTVGPGYSNTYERFLSTFQFLATTSEVVTCENVPMCWVPLIRWLGHEIGSCGVVVGANWDGDMIDWTAAYDLALDKRHLVEISSACRPELVHALFKVDTEWPCPLRYNQPYMTNFVVTTNGSFFRSEVLSYLRRLVTTFFPPTRRVIITPCFADKPYPSPVQTKILSLIDQTKWYLASATGVLGISPQPLWPFAPSYDAGVPNLERCEKIMRWFFTAHAHDAVVVYSDFYASAVHRAWIDSKATGKIAFVFGHNYRTSYEVLDYDLHLVSLLEHVAIMDRELSLIVPEKLEV